jgi:putative endonuclease
VRGEVVQGCAAYLLEHLGELARNRSRPFAEEAGEIDIVARRGGVLVFVEVKARADMETAGFSLQGRQFGRVAAAASLFVARHPHYAAHSLRYDAMLVVGLWPRHLPDVWRAPE